MNQLDQLRTILATHGRLAVSATQLTLDADLFGAGLDSMGMVNVMLAIEGAFDVEFPDHLLARTSFATLGTLQSVVNRLQADAA